MCKGRIIADEFSGHLMPIRGSLTRETRLRCCSDTSTNLNFTVQTRRKLTMKEKKPFWWFHLVTGLQWVFKKGHAAAPILCRLCFVDYKIRQRKLFDQMMCTSVTLCSFWVCICGNLSHRSKQLFSTALILLTRPGCVKLQTAYVHPLSQ